MLINTPVPDFALFDTNGRLHRLSQYLGRLVVVNFWSAECPWSERADSNLLAAVQRFDEQAVILPVASNLNETAAMIAQALEQRALDFVLVDEACRVADACGAQTTPHAFVVDQSGILRYQGALDDVTFRKRTPGRSYIDEALSALSGGRLPETQEAPPYGCTIVRHI